MQILYTSRTGTTREYARMLSQCTGMPCREAEKAEAAPDRDILYMGWLRAGRVVGLAEARKKWNVRGVCAVGLAYPTGEMTDSLRKSNGLDGETPLFLLQGGLFREKLGVYRLPMKLVVGSIIKKLEADPRRSGQDEDLLRLCREGGSRVCEANLAEVLRWWKTV